jgi:tripartite-type tricarboxylate transporter receptor subunit TctC
MNRHIRAAAALALAALLPLAATAQAQEPFPTRTVRLVVPNPPGGLPDTVARTIGQKLAEKWGQQVVIENKPGANGVVAAQAITSAPPDGYTLLVTDGSMFSANPYLYRDLPYDARKDFTPVSLTARAPLFLALHPSVPAGNFAEFVALVKSKPGQLSYGSSGVGSTHHLTMESIKAALGLDLAHIPYKGTGQSVPALLGNQVAAVFSAMPSIAGAVKENRLRLIAVNSAERSALAPNVPTIAESGVPGFDFAPNIGVSGPANMTLALASRIAADIAEVVRSPAMQESMRVLGIVPIGGSPQEYAALLDADRERYAKAVKASGVKAE